jgi:hypothetical protein
MSKDFSGRGELQPTIPQASAPKRRSIAFVELLTTAALALSTAVAVTAVSIGIARADVAGAVINGDGTAFAVALFIGLLVSGMSGLTALMAADQPPRH